MTSLFFFLGGHLFFISLRDFGNMLATPGNCSCGIVLLGNVLDRDVRGGEIKRPLLQAVMWQETAAVFSDVTRTCPGVLACLGRRNSRHKRCL